MASAISFSTAKSMTIAILQASQTAYATTVDGSNRQYSSDTEIANAILTADGEVATLIANTMQSPYQTTFIVAPATVAGPSGNLPARNGVILKVTCQGSPATATFGFAAVSTTADTATITAHGYATGTPVVYTASATVVGGLTGGNTYYVIRYTADAIRFATSSYNAFNNIYVDLTSQGNSTNTLTATYVDGTQADSKDTVVQATQNSNVFSSYAGGAAGFWFIEGDQIYTTSPNCKVTYTDYTLTASPQSPEPYIHAVVAGAVAELLKDGGDFETAQYYQGQYQSYLQSIAAGAMVIPAIAAYKGAQ